VGVWGWAEVSADMVKGVQREVPLVGDWGYPPAIILPPLLEERGTGVR